MNVAMFWDVVQYSSYFNRMFPRNISPPSSRLKIRRTRNQRVAIGFAIAIHQFRD
jgi:hypothetical protein